MAPFLIQVCLANQRKCYRSSGNALTSRFIDMWVADLPCSGFEVSKQDVVTSSVHAVVSAP
jgi:hypothetical protein